MYIRSSVFMTVSSARRGWMTSPITFALGKLGEAFSSEEQAVLLIDEIDKADLEFSQRPAVGAGSDGILYPRDEGNSAGKSIVPS